MHSNRERETAIDKESTFQSNTSEKNWEVQEQHCMIIKTEKQDQN